MVAVVQVLLTHVLTVRRPHVSRQGTEEWDVVLGQPFIAFTQPFTPYNFPLGLRDPLSGGVQEWQCTMYTIRSTTLIL